MNSFRTLFFLAIIIPNYIYSQVSVNIRAKQSRTKESKLYLYQNTETILIDSAYQNPQGFYSYNLPKSIKQGVYKFALGNNISFSFIIGSESIINLETVVYAAEDSLRSITSKENALYIDYQKIKQDLNHRLWLLNSLDDCYSDTSVFHKKLIIERYNTQLELATKSKNIVLNNPNLFVSNLILLELKPTPSTYLPDSKEFIRKNWWAEANLTDDRLINSNTLNSKVWGFIDLFNSVDLTKEQQDSLFTESIKIIMNLNSSHNIKLYLRKTLFDSFIDTDYGNTTRYLVETSFDALPLLDLTPEEKTAYDIQSKNRVGIKAKDFKINPNEGSKINLSKVSAQYKLVVFWSMWCPHCTEMLPELMSIYQKYNNKGFEVVAICIDEEVDGWKKYISENKFNWINTIETDNGKNKVLASYTVDGTPKFILIGKDMTILSCPINVKQLEAKLKELIK